MKILPLKKIESILVAVDFSEASGEALKEAVYLAEAFDAHLHVIHVYREKPTWADQVVTPVTLGYSAKNFDLLLHEASELHLEKFLKPFNHLKDRLTHRLVQGKPSEAIIEEANKGHHHLIVMGRAGTSQIPQVILGSTADRVIRHAPIPVLTLPHKAPEKIRNIMVAIDFSEASQMGLQWGLHLAKSFDARLTAIHVTVPPVYLVSPYPLMVPSSEPGKDPLITIEEAAQKSLDEHLKPLIDDGHEIKARVVSGTPALAITEAAEENQTDLLILGSHQKNALGHFILGSTAEKVLKLTRCPILITKF